MSGLGAHPPTRAGVVFVPSGDEIHTICFGLSRLDFLGSFDLILIRFDLGGGCAACFVCDEPDFRLTDDNMRRVRGTDGTHAMCHPCWNYSISQRFVHGFLRGSVNVPHPFHHAFTNAP